MKHSKRYRTVVEGLEGDKTHPLAEAVATVKRVANAKFDETVGIAIRLGVDPRKQDQMVRGSVSLPHGVGKERKVLVLTKGEKEIEAKDAGADYVGCEDLIKKISEGWFGFDAVVATPDVMSMVGKLGRILGPRKMMPTPKTGTVTFNIKEIVTELKKGRVDFRVDKSGNIHAPIGKVSFDETKLMENAMAFLQEIFRLKPASLKGQYLRSISISSTMGPGIKVSLSDVTERLRKVL